MKPFGAFGEKETQSSPPLSMVYALHTQLNTKIAHEQAPKKKKRACFSEFNRRMYPMVMFSPVTNVSFGAVGRVGGRIGGGSQRHAILLSPCSYSIE